MNELARDPKQIGNVIRRNRKKLGMSQLELGAKTGLRQATISQLEAGNPSVRMETLLAILAALDLELQIASRSKNWREDMENIL